MSLEHYSQTYKPFKYPEAIDFAIQSDRAAWGEWEAELQEDIKQWKTGILTPAEKNHITEILRLFTQTDVQVASNYCDRFIPFFRSHEIRQMLMSFASREAIHQRAYALLNDTLGMDESEYGAFLSDKDMKHKVDLMSDYHSVGAFPNEASIREAEIKTMAYQLAHTVCNEGMSLFSAFAMLMNYQRFGKMKGMCTVVEWSIRDETLHLQGMSWLFKKFCEEHPQIISNEFKKYIYSMYRQAVEVEDIIIDKAFAMGPIEGLTPEEMKVYIRYIADRRLQMLGLKANYEIETNPLPWLDWIMSGDSLKNFFEGRVSDYSVGNLMGDWGW
jgi:ribonucleoside-diphosphate reductase beta chain